MAIIPKYTLAQKFENGKKPPEWDFWAWQDSYWHKEEKIPQTAIENLAITLAKKADLENGMIREDQLPFSVVTSEVIALGAVEIVDNQVKLSVHSSGANKVRVKGQLITRAFPNQWYFTPIAGNGVKVIRGYALKNQTDFFIAESDELPEMMDPEIPENALQIFRLIINSDGVSVDQGATAGLKTKSQDNWTTSLVNVDTPVALSANGSSSNFIVTKTSFAGSVTLKGIIIDTPDLWDGKEFYIKNETGVDIIFSLATAETLPPEKALLRFTDLDLILKPDITALFRIFNGNLKPVKYTAGDGGSASFPVSGNDGDPLVKDSNALEGVKFSGDIPAAIDAEIVNRAAEDLAEKNARIAGDNYLLDQLATESTNRANADLLKLNKPAAPNNTAANVVLGDGSTKPLTDIGMDKSGLVNKMLSYWDSTLGKLVSSGLKFVAGVVNQLEFVGRIKADAFILPANTNTAIANRLRSDGNRLYFANNSAVENTLVFTSDLENDRLLSRYVHSGNTELYPSAVNYTTGYLTVPNHGLVHGGQLLVGLFSSYISNGILAWNSQMVIPFEWGNAITYIKVIDSNTLMICDSAGAIIPVNPTSSQNNNRLDITKWHIEIFAGFETPQCAVGVKKFTVTLKGMSASYCQSYTSRRLFLYVYNTSNQKVPFDLTFAANFLNNPNNKNNVAFVQKLDIDLRESFISLHTNMEYGQLNTGGGVNNNAAGFATIFLSGNIVPVNGVFSVGCSTSITSICNGTVIEIFRQ